MNKTAKTYSRRGPIDTSAVRQLQRGRRVEGAQRARGQHGPPPQRVVRPIRRDRALTRFLELTRDA